MAKAIALVRTHVAAPRPADLMRSLIVGACGLALAFAGPILPF